MKIHYLKTFLFLFYVGGAAALPDCSISGIFDNCYGTEVLYDRTYVGDWQDGKQHGQGSLTFEDGSKYVGGFNNSMYNGSGIFTWDDGGKYIGEFKDDALDGEGTQ